IGADRFGRELPSIAELDRDPVGIPNHMLVREDHTILGDDEARPCSLLAKFTRLRLMPLRGAAAKKALQELVAKRVKRIVEAKGTPVCDGFFYGNKHHGRGRLPGHTAKRLREIARGSRRGSLGLGRCGQEQGTGEEPDANVYQSACPGAGVSLDG